MCTLTAKREFPVIGLCNRQCYLSERCQTDFGRDGGGAGHLRGCKAGCLREFRQFNSFL